MHLLLHHLLASLGSAVSRTRHRLARLGSRSSKQLLLLLASTARGVIRRQRPFVVGVTGSVGKTSAKVAIGAVLATGRRVRASPKNYNNEIGFPVAIIGSRAPGRSPLAWLALIARGLLLALFRSRTYPEALVLEYGADHPGDIAALTAIARPQIAVLTAIGAAHTEFFQTVEGVAEEKWSLIAALPPDGIAVLNADDVRVMALRPRTPCRVVTYGFADAADVRAEEMQVAYQTLPLSASAGRGGAGGGAVVVPSGISCTLAIGSITAPLYLPGILGLGHVSAALAAAAVGHALGIALPDIVHALVRYVPQHGRMRIIPGIKGATIIDDSYNSSPLAVAVALEALAGVQTNGRRIAVLGDMLELGPLTEREHFRVGELVAASTIEYFVCVGEAMQHAAAGARRASMPEDRIRMFDRAAEAGRFVQDLLHQGDIVLVKGSQGVRLEKVVKELMADPLRAGALLCRQDGAWLTS